MDSPVCQCQIQPLIYGFCGDFEPRIDQDKVKRGQGGAFGEPVADPGGPDGFPDDEKRDVRPERRSDPHQLLRGQRGSVHFVERQEGRGGIGASAAQSRGDRDPLPDRDRHVRGFSDAGKKSRRRAVDDVPLVFRQRRAGATDGQAAGIRREGQVVAEADPLHQREDVVVTVFALPENPQVKIDLGRGRLRDHLEDISFT